MMRMKTRTRALPIGAAGVALLLTALANACDSDGDSTFNENETDTDASAGAGGSIASGGTFGGGSGGSLGHYEGGGGSSSPDGACGQSQITAGPRQVNILLVIDKSDSMRDSAAGFTTDKWTAMKSALTATLNAAKDRIDFGLVLFPYQANSTPIASPACGARCCEMPAPGTLNVGVEDGATGVPKILGVLNATPPSGATPTAKALSAALQYFTTGAGATLAGDRYVLLATDGGPNCNAALTCDANQCTDEKCPGADAGANCCVGLGDACLDAAATASRVTALRTAGVSTFVVGIPGSERYRATLDALAVAGGRPAAAASPRYYAVSAAGAAPGGLTDVLQSITQTLITTCRLQLTTTPPNFGLLNVNIDGRNVPKSGPDGWDLDTSTSPPTVVLKGATCSHIEASGAQNVQILYGCPTEEVPE